MYAGVLDFATGVHFVAARSAAMAAAFPNGYGMGAITGVPIAVVEAMVGQVRASGNHVFIANLNAPDQTVISGTQAGVQQVLEIANERGARKAIMVSVTVPSHNELMSAVAQRLADTAKTVHPKRPRIPCVSNSSARLLYDGASLLDDLVWSVSRPVRWHDATVAIYEAGVRIFLEMPPGQVLTRLAESAFPDARCLAIEESGIDSAVAVAKA